MSLQLEPDVAFGSTPEFGIAAALADERPFLDEVLRKHDFVYEARLDVYRLPPEVPHTTAVGHVIAATREFQDAGLSVVADPRAILPTGDGTGALLDASPQATLQAAVLHLTDRMTGAATYTDAAAVAEEVLHTGHGVLERLREFFEAAAEQANAFEDIEGWQLADRFADAATQLNDLTEELADSPDELRALGPPEPRWQPDAATRRSANTHRTSAATPMPAATTNTTRPVPNPGPRRPR